ncbi:MAG: ATP synthase subunit I [Pyrinomonadaceae bacterium]
MSDEIEPVVPVEQAIVPLSHRRILVIMAVIGLAGSILGSALISVSFGAGVFIGSVLAFVNYYWLKVSLKKIFDLAAETGEKPRLLALKYFARYLVLGTVVAILYATAAVSIVGVILGMGAFGFAVVIEGILRIFSNPVSEKEI